MRISKRTMLLAASGLAVVAMLAAALVVFHPGGAQAASGSTLTGVRGTVSSRAGTSTSVPHGVQPNLDAVACANMTDFPPPTNCDTGGDDANAPGGNGAGAPHLKGRPAANSPFNGAKGGNGKGAPNTPDNGRAGAGASSPTSTPSTTPTTWLLSAAISRHPTKGFVSVPPARWRCWASPATAPSSWR